VQIAAGAAVHICARVRSYSRAEECPAYFCKRRSLKETGVPIANSKRLTASANQPILAPMSDLCRLIWCALIGLFRSRAALEAEILVLRHQLNVVRRKSPKRLAFGNMDRLVYRVAPGVLDTLKILKPRTVIR
jgi:hypothetical protein